MDLGHFDPGVGVVRRLLVELELCHASLQYKALKGSLVELVTMHW